MPESDYIGADNDGRYDFQKSSTPVSLHAGEINEKHNNENKRDVMPPKNAESAVREPVDEPPILKLRTKSWRKESSAAMSEIIVLEDPPPGKSIVLSVSGKTHQNVAALAKNRRQEEENNEAEKCANDEVHEYRENARESAPDEPANPRLHGRGNDDSREKNESADA